jgi:hypothetical protein
VKLAVLDRLSTVLSTPDSGSIKTSFVQNGGLQLVQEIGEEPGSPYQQKVSHITALFPQELVNRYSPAYNKALLERLTLGEPHANMQPQQQQQPLVQQQQQQAREFAVASIALAPQPPACAAPVPENTTAEIKPISPRPNKYEGKEEELVQIKEQQQEHQLPPKISTEDAVAEKNTLKTKNTNRISPAATTDTMPHDIKEEKPVIAVTASPGSPTASFSPQPAPQPPVPTASSPSPSPLSWSAPLPQTPRDAAGSTPSPRPSDY